MTCTRCENYLIDYYSGIFDDDDDDDVEKNEDEEDEEDEEDKEDKEDKDKKNEDEKDKKHENDNEEDNKKYNYLKYKPKYIDKNLMYCHMCFDFIVLKNIKHEECKICGGYYLNNDIYIKNYNNYYICNECNNNDFNNNIIFSENYLECLSCKENKKLIKLVSCEHYICVDCYSNNYNFCYEKNYKEDLEKYKPRFPYDEFEKEKEYLEYYNYTNMDYEDYIKLNEKEKNKLRQNYSELMTQKEIIEYERKEIIYYNLSKKNNENKLDYYLLKIFITPKTCPICK
jgi:hypothetical protein